MKRKSIYSVALFLTLFMLFSVNVFAADHKITLNEVGISLNVPEDYDVITRDTTLDEIKSVYDVNNAEQVYLFVHSDNVYLEAIKNHGDVELVVTTNDVNLEEDSFQDLSEEDLKSYTYSMAMTFQEEYEVQDYYAYQQGQNNFIFLHLSDEDGEHWQSTTAYEGKLIDISITWSDGTKSSVIEEELQTVIDSIEFGVEDAPVMEENASAADEKLSAIEEEQNVEDVKKSLESEHKASPKAFDLRRFFI